MTDRLSLYNGALMICGERALASLSENREPRRLLDSVWTRGAVRACLEMGHWKFAQRTMKLIYDPSITSQFGLNYAVVKGDDWVKTTAICSDEYQTRPYLNYRDEANFLYFDLQELFVSYVSDDNAYGGDLSIWPETFREYVEFYLASRIIKRLTQGQADTDSVNNEMKIALETALNKDAVQGPTRLLPPGSWVNARRSNTNPILVDTPLP